MLLSYILYFSIILGIFQENTGYALPTKQFISNSTILCADFYEYVCGSSIKNMRESAVKTIEKIQNTDIAKLLQEDKNANEPVSVHKVKDAFKACMDEKERKLAKNLALLHTLNEIGGWPIINTKSDDNTKWELLAATLRHFGYSLLFKTSISIDRQNPSKHILLIDSLQTEIIPDSSTDFLAYLRTIAVQSTFIKNVALLLGATDDECIKKDIKDILQLQMLLNQISILTQRQNIHQSYQKMKISDLNKLNSNKVDWLAYLNAVFNGIKQFRLNDEVAILNVEYIKKLGEILTHTDLRILKNYLLWRFVKDVAEDGDPAMVSYNWAMKGGANTRLDTCLKEVKGFLGFAVSNLYLKNKNHQPHIDKILEVFKFVRSAIEQLIDQSQWMDAQTKIQAISKLRKMTPKLGYPNWIKEARTLDKYYNKINVNTTGHFSNILQMSTTFSLEELALINAPVDANSWVISPLTVNAFYHISLNDIYIPLGIMKEPFLNLDWPMAAIFGAIGTVIGHEITHGFEEESSMLPVTKTNAYQWSATTAAGYQKATKCVTNQYNNYCPAMSLSSQPSKSLECINGERTLRENVADIGGVRAAYKALQLWKVEHGDDPEFEKNGNVTSNQLFFIHYAKLWCEDSLPTSLLSQLQTSLNSPNKYRLIGSLENFQEFDASFNCPSSAKLSRKPMCNIW